MAIAAFVVDGLEEVQIHIKSQIRREAATAAAKRAESALLLQAPGFHEHTRWL